MQVFRAAALARTFGIAVAILWATVGVAVAQGTTGFDRRPCHRRFEGRPAWGDRHDPGSGDRAEPRPRDRPAGAIPRRRSRPRQYAVTVELSGLPDGPVPGCVPLGRAGGGAGRPDADRRHHGAGRRGGRRHAGRDAAVGGDGARRSEPDSRVAAQRPRLHPVDAAPARRHLVSHHRAGGRSRHGHPGLGRRRPAEPDQLPGGRRGREHPGQRRARQRRRRHARRRHRARVPGARQQLQRRIRPQHGGDRRGRHALGHEQLHGFRLRVQPQQHVRLAHLLRRSDQVDSTPQAQSVRRHARRTDCPATRRSSSAATKAFARRRG